MPWRRDVRPYYVLISEVMLQQTQVARVVPKFRAFITRFPDIETLASAQLASVLELWSGLGYNRRAKYLWQAAHMIVNDFDGVFPHTPEQLQRLPGVGVNTAGAIVVYAFNQPVCFIETNVRTVYMHHFFATTPIVNDRQIIAKLQATLDPEAPREFYWALMDYGAWLKASGVRLNGQSQHYKKQTPLEGSVRQMRGQLIRRLLEGRVQLSILESEFSRDARFHPALEGLVQDDLVVLTNGYVGLTTS